MEVLSASRSSPFTPSARTSRYQLDRSHISLAGSAKATIQVIEHMSSSHYNDWGLGGINL